MSSVVISGDTSGSITLSAPLVSGSSTQTLAAVTGTLAPIVSGTAQNSTSGTSIDFTGIPNWVKRITVMFSGVSTSGTSNKQIQIGAGSVTTSGYVGSSSGISSTVATTSFTTGFGIRSNSAADVNNGSIIITNISSNTWVALGTFSNSSTETSTVGGSISLGGTLDRIRLTTVNGTDTFDAGSINILYE